MALRRTALALLALSVSGCACHRVPGTHAVDAGKVVAFADSYRRAKEDGFSSSIEPLRLVPDTGLEKPYVPVYQPPHIVKVWIPAHVAAQDKDVMIAGHWSFVVVTPPRWYIEGESRRQDMPAVMPGMPRGGQI